MHLTAFSDYTLRTLIYLSLHRDSLATIHSIAESYDISDNHLMKVVSHLSHTGVIETVRGKGGGMRLARPPEQIRIGDIVRASEGDAPIIECLGNESRCCISHVCSLGAILGFAFDALYADLNRYTLADLVKCPGPLIRQLNIQPQFGANRTKTA